MRLAVSRRWGRLFYCVAPLALLLGAGPRTYASEPAKTLISDIIYRADGTPASGTLLVSWPAFTTAEGKAVAAGTAGVKIGAGGAVTMHLVPNEGATPGGTYYRVTLKLDDGSSAVEYWTVPQLSPTTISAIRASMVPAAVAAQMVSRTYLDAELAQAVHRSGDESIGGVKTFSSSPVVPEPSSDLQAANKQYVDAAAAGGGSSILALSRGGTGQNTWTAGRCVRVADDGSQLEPAAGDCGSGTGSNADTVDGQHAAGFAGTVHTHTKSAISDWTHTHLKSEIGDFPSTWDWLAVSNKPGAYPPEAHNHVKAQITDWAHSHLKAEISDFAHTHVKAAITDFPTSWDWNAIGNKPSTFSPSAHGHAIADVTNLQSSMDGKASTGHTHVKAAITDFPAQWDWSAISGKPSTFAPPVPTRSAIGGVFMDAACGAGQHVSDIDGSGKLVCSADASTGGTDWSAITNKPSSYPSDWSTTSNKPSSYTPSAHGHAESDVTGLTTELAAKESAANKGAANGYASLDASAQVPAGQIPNLPESKITNLTTDLAGKAADAAVVHNSGNETIAGSKTFSSTIAGSITGTAAGLSAQYVDWNAASGGTSIANKPTLGTAAALNVPGSGNAGAGEVVKGSDTRLIDARTPLGHGHAESDVTGLTTDLAAKAADTAVVHNSGNETIAGSKTFSSTIAGSVSGNAGTATALAGNGSNCSAGQAATGVDSSGNAEGCFTPSGSGDMLSTGANTMGAAGKINMAAAAAADGFTLPTAAGAAPSGAGRIAYDSTANVYKGHNGTSAKSFAYTDSNISGTAAGLSANIAESQVTNLTADLAGKESAANKGAANGYASLDASAQVPAGQIPNLAESKITNLTTDLAAKAADTAVVHNSGNETIAGSKTFSSAIAGSITGTAAGLSANIAESQVTNLTTDLGSKADKASVTAGTQTKITYNAQGIVTGGAQAQFSDLGGSVGASQLPNPGASSKGGVQAKTCTGTDKISAIGSDAIPVCSADAGGSGADLNTPNTFTKAQTLAPDSDTAGLVVKAGTASPANNISILAASSAGVEKTWVDKDFKLHTQGLILEGTGPSIWTLTSGTNSSPVEGDFWNDTDVLKFRTSGGATKDLAFLDSSITGTAAGLTGKSFSGNGTVVGTAGSTRTAGKQVQFDASGNLVASSYDVGAAGGGAPGGTGTEMQYRAGASTFGAVTGSSVSGSDVTFGGKVQSGGSGPGVFYGAEGAATGNPGAGNYRLYVDATHNFKCEYGASPTACAFPSGSMVYPGAGVAVSTGSAWGTSKAAPSGEIVGTSDSQQLSNKTFGTGMTWPTFNQNTSGTAGGLSAAYIDWNAGSGGASIQNKPTAFAPSNHALVSSGHTASGLTTGQPLRATGSGTFDFGALDLGNANAITGTLPWASQAHSAANVVGLFNSGSCGTTQYLKGDGSCGTPGGAGDVVAGTISDNTIAKISSAASKTIGNSLATDNGTTLAYSGTGGISATTGAVQSGGSGGGVIYGPTAGSAPANPAAGNFKLWVDASGNLNCKRDATGTSCVPVPSDVRSVSYIAGADNASADLTAADDQGTIWRNNLGATYRVTEVWCESNAGTPTINLQRDDGTPANLLSGDLTCTTAGATGSVASAEQDVAAGERIDFLLQAASAGAKRITVSIRVVKQ